MGTGCRNDSHHNKSNVALAEPHPVGRASRAAEVGAICTRGRFLHEHTPGGNDRITDSPDNPDSCFLI